MGTQNELPDNVGAARHPVNENYIMFTTFDAADVVDETGNSLDTLDLPNYRDSIKKMVTVMEYEWFQTLLEASNSDVAEAGRMFHLPQTIRRIDELPAEFGQLILSHCEDFGPSTKAIVRFFEFDKEEGHYQPVDVQFEDGKMVQADLDEEE